MFIKRMKIVFILLMTCFINQPIANALAVSNTFIVGEKNGSGELQVINNDGKDMFVKFTMSKVVYENGNKKIIPLNEDTLENWNLTITPPQMVISDKERKSIALNYLCSPSGKNECNKEEDQFYAIKISPTPYSESGNDSAAIAFGYNLYYMIPAENVDLVYSIKRQNNREFYFENSSNTMLTAVFNTCKTKYSNNCIYQYRLISGTKGTFKLPEEVIDQKDIDVTIINANQVIRKYVSI